MIIIVVTTTRTLHSRETVAVSLIITQRQRQLNDKIEGKDHDDDEDLALERDGALVAESGHQLLEEHRRLVALWHLCNIEHPHDWDIGHWTVDDWDMDMDSNHLESS